MSGQTAVSIFMGSKSDLSILQFASDILKEFNITHNMFILSAHRTPEEVVKKIKESEANGVQVFIAAAGMAAVSEEVLDVFLDVFFDELFVEDASSAAVSVSL
jgi:phosphoribosylaminoimidazole carboxylase PurE protein